MKGIGEGRPAAGRTALILCGGRSSRFGRDKALEPFGAGTLLSRAIETARVVSSQLLLAVGAWPRYEEQGIPIVLDAFAGRGPLAGIVAGLERAEHDTFLALAVDLPFVTPAVVERLFEALPGHDLVIPRTERGLEPLCVVGRTKAGLEAARRLLQTPDPAVRNLARELRTREYAAGEGGIPAACFLNVNTPSDLEQALRKGPGHRAGTTGTPDRS